ncbi:MAG: IMP dehydrogenase [Kiritimatiellae bacterium]|jgi:IMP dehydrogenase|nr:IMP dehydrogenase [Kiritimatiellia bacterium]
MTTKYKNEFVQAVMAESPYTALTFDDVTLITQYADFLPDQTSIKTKLTNKITLNIPFLSAAMDTVTESDMAIALACEGGIGVIHKNLDMSTQASNVAKVKHYLNGLIQDPIVFNVDDTIAKVLEVKKNRKFGFSGFPIVDENGCLAGILTSSDIKYSEKYDLKIKDIMTSNVFTAPPETTLADAYTIMRQKKIGKLPLVEDGKLVGLYSFTDVQNIVSGSRPLHNLDDKFRLRAAAAVSAADYDRVERLASEDVDVIIVDSAHGHTKGVMEMTTWIKKHYSDIEVIAGNICTAEAAIDLRNAGADAVKVGIGPGSICTTRVVCGVGVPQLTAVYNCASALQDSIPIIADGGIRLSGDVPKAIVAGASTVMLGSLLAGTDESPGEKILHQGRQYVVYRGMGSLASMTQGKGSRERYSQADVQTDDLVPQGIEGIVPYAGSMKKVMNQLCGGLRSSLGYCGCKTIEEMQANGKFVKVTGAGLHESHPHDVKIMKEAPNYRS